MTNERLAGQRWSIPESPSKGHAFTAKDEVTPVRGDVGGRWQAGVPTAGGACLRSQGL